MAFRMILVGVVASLGFDLPTGRDVETWADTGRAWFEARVTEFQARQELESAGELLPEAEPDLLTGLEDEDLAFAAVVEEMVSAFANHQARPAQKLEEPVPVAGDAGLFGNELADALNGFADGLSEPVEPAPVADLAPGRSIASLDRAEPGSITADVELLEVSELDQATPTGSRADRVSQAFQLTGQALQAWMTVLQPGLTTAPLAD